MPEITLTEGESAAKYDFVLRYSQNWSDAARRGQLVAQADVATVFFYVKRNFSDASPWLSLSTANAAQVRWVNGPGATDGRVRVYFGTGTSAHVGDGQHYELRVKFTDGTYLTAESGTFNVLESVVDQAA